MFLTIIIFDRLRDFTDRVQIRNIHLALLGIAGALPDVDVFLVPFFGWGIHKVFTHSLVATLVFSSAMLGLFFSMSHYRFRALLLLAAIAYLGHTFLDYTLRSIPLLYPWSGQEYGIQILGATSTYFTFTTVDTSVYALTFLYFLVTEFKSFRYKFDLPHQAKWFQIQVGEQPKHIRLTTGFLLKKVLDCTLSVQILKEAKRRGVNLYVSSATEPSQLYYASTFYESEPEYAYDANLIINVREINGDSAKIAILPANYTGLAELIEEVTRRRFTRFDELE